MPTGAEVPLSLAGGVELRAIVGESSPRMSTRAALGVSFASPGGPLADVGGERLASGFGFGGSVFTGLEPPLLSPFGARGVLTGFASAIGGAVDGGAPVGCDFAGGAIDGGAIDGGVDDGGPIAFAWPPLGGGPALD